MTSIGYHAFYGCIGLTSITIPEGVTSIGEEAFRGCSGLTSITIPEGVTSIGKDAFHGCSGLTSITILEGVTSIGEDAFHGCSGLTSITIPEGVTSIGKDAFEDCSGLASIIVASGNTAYDSRNNCNAIIETSSNTLIAGCKNTIIPNSVTSIGRQAFRGCSGLTSITIPEGVTSIGKSAFYGCSGLTSITIPEGVTSIGDNAFYGCSGLTSITIPEGVTSIGEDAFRDCENITKVYSFITNPFTIDKWTFGVEDINYADYFNSIVYNTATLYVPVGTLEKYKATSGWKDFVNIEEGNPSGINVIENTKNNKTTIYDLNGVRLSEPKEGIIIINGKKVVLK